MTAERQELVIIRALTLHVTRMDEPYIEQEVSKFLEKIDDIKKELEIDTLRIVTPKVTRRELETIADILQRQVDVYGIDIFAIPLREISQPEKIADNLYVFPALYTSFEYKKEESTHIVELLKALSERSWILPTRFAVSFGKLYTTPYFPATTSEKEGVTASLLYTELYRNNPHNIDVVKEKLYMTASILKEAFSDFIGIDYSLSPWMDYSVAEVVEMKSGVQFTLPGTIEAIININREISTIAAHMGIGYNEIMLPLGEDNRLKELALAGQLRFSHLLNYTSYCVAGLDMVPIPDTTDQSIIEGILRDLEAIHRRKGKTLGMRIIPVGAEEGEEVDLGIFGRVPVLSPLY